MHKLIIFIPEDSRGVREGCLGLRQARVRWVPTVVVPGRLGVGQFLLQPSANPHIGQPGVVEQVQEWRVELLVPDTVLDAVVDALYANNPHEEPAFDLIRVIEPVPRT